MLTEVTYNREAATQYAIKWAFAHNSIYHNFEENGEDSTNFASQCICAGSGIMNYTPVMGWYYNNKNDCTPSWSRGQYLYNFLIYNKSVGPFAEVVDKREIEPGDIIQLGDSSRKFYHSPVVISIDGDILVAAHTVAALYKPISSYEFEHIRYIHMKGIRKYV